MVPLRVVPLVADADPDGPDRVGLPRHGREVYGVVAGPPPHADGSDQLVPELRPYGELDEAPRPGPHAFSCLLMPERMSLLTFRA
jgi:hypothetical protein